MSKSGSLTWFQEEPSWTSQTILCDYKLVRMCSVKLQASFQMITAKNQNEIERNAAV